MPIYPAYPEVEHGSWMWHDEATVLTGNAFTHQLDTSAFYRGFSLQNPGANGDSFSHQFFVKAGTYTLYILGITGLNVAKIDWYIDNVLVASGQDWYTLPTVYNVIKTVAALILTDGEHVLKGVVNGRNAANTTGFNIDFTAYWLKQASD